MGARAGKPTLPSAGCPAETPATDLPEGGASPALSWRFLALPESRRAPKATRSLSGDPAPAKTPVQSRERVGLKPRSGPSGPLYGQSSPPTLKRIPVNGAQRISIFAAVKSPLCAALRDATSRNTTCSLTGPIGPGTVHRAIEQAQRLYFDPPHNQPGPSRARWDRDRPEFERVSKQAV